MTFQSLVTTYNCSDLDIIEKAKSMMWFGDVLVAVERKNDHGKHDYFLDDGTHLTIYASGLRGATKKRNFLLSISTADLIVFLDDDVQIDAVGFRKYLPEFEKIAKKYKAIRFNAVSYNDDRPLPIYHKRGKISKFKMTSAIFSTVFLRKHLIDNHVLFNENIGPGSPSLLKFSDDVDFMQKYCRTGKVYNIPETLFFVAQDESSWYSGVDSNYLKSVGFSYRIVFGKIGFVYLFYHFLKHNKKYKFETDYSSLTIWKLLKNGFKYKEGWE